MIKNNRKIKRKNDENESPIVPAYPGSMRSGNHEWKKHLYK